MWKKPAMAFGGAVIAVALVIGIAALIRQPPAETPIAAVTTTQAPNTTMSPETTTTAAPTTTTEAGPMTGPGCPDADFEAPGPQEGLPEPVATIRAQIIAAALACDVDALAALGGPDLNTSFGGGNATVFRRAVESGDPLLELLVTILGTPFAIQTYGDAAPHPEDYVWPSAFAYEDEIPPADLEALLTFYTQEELDRDIENFGGYVGWRVGITPEGDWHFFVAGD